MMAMVVILNLMMASFLCPRKRHFQHFFLLGHIVGVALPVELITPKQVKIRVVLCVPSTDFLEIETKNTCLTAARAVKRRVRARYQHKYRALFNKDLVNWIFRVLSDYK